MSGDYPVGIVDVEVYRTEFNSIKTSMLSAMERVGASVHDDLDRARSDCNDAFNSVRTAALITPLWDSPASNQSLKLMDDLRDRAQVHQLQRLEQFDAIDVTAAEITSLLNS